MEHLPPLPELDLTGNVSQNWLEWIEEFQVFLRAVGGTKKPADVKLATFLHLIGRQARKVANTFSYATGEDVTLETVIEKFRQYCMPRKHEMYARFKLEHTQRKDGETVDQFLTRLKIIAKDCEYDTQEDKILRDRIVFSLQDERLRERLLEKEDLTLEKAMEVIRSSEVSRAQSQSIKEGAINIQSLRKEQQQNIPQTARRKLGAAGLRQQIHNPRNKSRIKPPCNKCGRSHIYRNCPAYGKTCLKCGKPNHYAKQCNARTGDFPQVGRRPRWSGQHQSQAVSSRAVHELGDEDSDTDSTGLYLQEIHIGLLAVDNVHSAWYEAVRVAGQRFTCKLDSGAQANVLPYKFYKMIQRKIMLRPTTVTLIAFGGKRITPKGTITVEAEINGQKDTIKFAVVDVNATPILRLDTCSKLHLLERGKGRRLQNVDQVSQNDFTSESRLIAEYGDVFSGIGCYPEAIHLETRADVAPVVHAARKIPVALQSKLKGTLDDLEEKGIINKVTYPTEWVNSLIMVEKPDGTIRLCLDPRDLNRALKREHYKMPTGEDIFLKLKGMEYFTVIDMKWGFWNVPLDSASADLCVFNTPYGRYRFNRMPFGISVAPEIFQRLNDQHYGDIMGIGISTDDFIIGGKTKQDCYNRVQEVLNRARQKNNKFNAKKIQFCKKQVKFLGRLVSAKGVEMDPVKIQAINDLKPPSDKKELKTFLGMVTYLMPFVPKLTELTAPFRDLIKERVQFQWDAQLNKAFEDLKHTIGNGTKLVHFDPNKLTVLQTDASQFGLGGCLMQDGCPVAYTSRALTDVETRYAQIEKEFLAIVNACEKFHYYIYGIPVDVHTDHKPLISILNKTFEKITPRLQRFVLRIQRYNVRLVYTPGKDLKVADALSRNFAGDRDNSHRGPHGRDEIVHDIQERFTRISPKWDARIKMAMLADSECQTVTGLIQSGWPEHRCKVSAAAQKYWDNRLNLHVYKGLILSGWKILIPREVRLEILKTLHESHLGVEKIKARARQIVYWPGISRDIEEYVSQCGICQEHRNANKKEPLQPYAGPLLPWHTVGMDIFEIGTDIYLIIVDYFSRYPEVVMLPNKTAGSVVKACKQTFARHGVPQIIRSDNMPFRSVVFTDFCTEWNIALHTSSPGYPQSNGMAERCIQTVKRLYKKARQSRTDVEIALLEYRTTPLSGSRFSPSQLLMSRVLRTKLPTIDRVLKPKVCMNVGNNLKKRQIIQKRYYDRQSAPLSRLKRGEVCRIRENGSWFPAKVANTSHFPRSYWVENNLGNTVRRNRKHLLRIRTPPLTNYPSSTEGIKRTCPPSTLLKPPQVLTRSGRQVKPPVRYPDS